MNFIKLLKITFVLLSIATLSNADQKIRTIAFAQDTMANDFRKAQVFEVRDAVAKHSELKFIYSDAKGKTSLMIRQIEKFIIQKVDLIIVGTNNAKSVVPVVAKAYHSGIPVIVLDRGIEGDEYTSFINSDNIKIGKMGAKYIASQLDKKSTVLLFEGIQTADVTHLRTKGFMDEISKHKNIKVIKRTGNYLRKDAIKEMERVLKEGIKVDAIFSESDSMLSGVRTVLYKHNIDPASIIMVGCDYTSEAQEAIKRGTQTASILFPLGGKFSVDIALKIFNNEKVPKHIFIPVELVTKKNVNTMVPIF